MQCRWACASFGNIGNPLNPFGNIEVYAKQAEAIGYEEADKINSDRESEENISLRHCIASAYLATKVGCGCAKCLGTAREQHQYYEYLIWHAQNPGQTTHGPGNTQGEAQRGICRNGIGVSIVGAPARMYPYRRL